RTNKTHKPLQTLIPTYNIVYWVFGNQIIKARISNQAAGGLGRATEQDPVPMRGQFAGNWQGSRRQSQIVSGYCCEKKRRHTQSFSNEGTLSVSSANRSGAAHRSFCSLC